MSEIFTGNRIIFLRFEVWTLVATKMPATIDAAAQNHAADADAKLAVKLPTKVIKIVLLNDFPKAELTKMLEDAARKTIRVCLSTDDE